ncbi:sperm flagellar protein 2-like [Bacillus rossius redtenbacheri]|uniref:sperm flagellar protein 2-like n=1 Tax=Bacillus rossius redtenbacheri TaxID=93214 RepID=UPI002FDEC8CE
MGEIIRQWLFRKTGVLINLEEQDFGLNFSDGTLLTKLLQSYSIINADVAETIRPTENHNIKVSNIYRLQKLLKLIGIHCNNTTVEEIALGFDTTALKLIYELFMSLEGNEKSYFIAQMKETKSENSSLELSFETDLPYPVTKQCPPVNNINEKLNILEGHQNRYKAIIKKCKNAKVEAREALRNQLIYKDPCATDNTPKHKKQSLKEKEIHITKISMDDFSLKHESNEMELTYENLIQLKETSENSALMTASKTKANELLNLIRQRTRREAASQAFRHSMRTLLLTELWDRLLEQYEKVFDEGVLQKLLRQSLYEKQIATKLLLVRHEQKTIAQNRIRRNKLILDRQQTELTLDYLKKNAEKELETYELNIEKKRKLELHRRLYADKLKRKYEKHYSLCHEILDAIVDLSVKSSLYQKCFDYEVPSKLWEEWKLSFIKGLPIFENIENLELMLNEEYQENLDPSVTIEVERNEVLIDHEFKDYMNLSGLWSLDELNSDLLSYKEELEVLGFVVHRLLATKYPKPVPKKLVALPNAKVAAVVVGMDPDQTLDVLQELLHSRGIVVVTLKTVLDESVRAYHKEILAKRDFDASTLNLYMALNGTPNTEKPTVNENKDKNTPLKSMLEKLNGVTNELEGIATVKDKATQTPRIVPYDDDTSYPSRKAELGKIIYEILLQGQHIPDHLLVDNLIEFLRENTSDSGWVLINFPSTYQQAAFIEESITGQKLPQISSQTQTAAESNENIEIINSKSPGEELQSSQSLLLPNPIPEPKTEPFRTYFSVYVKLEKTEDDPAKFQILLNSEGSPIENIYREQGVIYSFSYKTFNFDTIQNLAKLVIGERDPPLKSSEELFGKALEDVASKFFPPKKPDKTSKKLRKEKSPKTVPQSEDQPQIPTKEKKSSKTKKKKIQFKETDSKGKTKKLKTDKSKKRKHDGKTDTKSSDEISSEKSEGSTITDDEIIQQETEAKPEAITQTPDQKPLELEQPQEAHRFVEPDIPSEFQVVLATVWETAEKVYIETMKQVFFLMRIHRSTIAPYEKFIRDKFAEFIRRPDEKQQVVSKFQLQFNEVDEELREFAEMKSELHCRLRKRSTMAPCLKWNPDRLGETLECQAAPGGRVSYGGDLARCRVWELESLLTNACDTREQESEAERRRVAGQSWVPGELAVLGGAYAAGAQAEVDRAIDTLQLAADYYLAALGKPPPLPRLDRVALLPRGSDGESPCNIPTASDAPSRRPTRSERSDASSKPSAVTRWLLDELNGAEPPLQGNDAFTAIDAADRVLEASAGLVRDLASREKHELGQKMGGDKKKKTKKRPKRPEIQSLDDEANKATFEKRGRVIEEWEEAIASEVNRATFRLKLLRSRARRDLTELLTRMRKMFQDIREQIAQRYEREVGAVQALCEVLRAAVEEETPLQQELVLEQDRFLVRLDALVFPDPPPTAATRADEPSPDSTFRVDQLQWLAATFRYQTTGRTRGSQSRNIRR